MKLKQYSRPLDFLIASVEAYRKGNTELAGRLFVKASSLPGIDSALNVMDAMNAAAQGNKMAASITAAKTAVKAAEGDDDNDEDDKKEESDSDSDEDINLEESDESLDDDLDSILDGMDDEEVSENLHDESPEEMADAGENSPDGADNLNDVMPDTDKNEPASVTAGKKKVKAKKKKAKASVNDERTQRAARNLAVLSRLSTYVQPKK
jgi:hypothetical protein